MSATHIFYPMPRRPANLELSQQPSTPMLSPNISNGIPSRTHSALNLSSSTLLGIFSPSYFDPDQESPSLMGSPPSHQNQISRNVLDKISYQSQPLQKTKLFNFFLRVLLLFATGMGFGFLIQHLLDEKQPSSILFKIISDRKIEWIYLLSWGMSGVTIGTLLPLMDQPPSIDKHISQGSVISSVSTANKETSSKQFDILDQDWTPIIRSVGAFVGITYALRKLSWTSNFQASLALTIVNPVLWYLFDRSRPGFLLSTLVGFSGTALLLLLKSKFIVTLTDQTPLIIKNSNLLQAKVETNPILLSLVDGENLEDSIWILSILFCSCVCFGTIGRRLAINVL